MDKATFFKVKPKTEVVEIPDLGPVTVRGLSAGEYDRYEKSCAVSDEEGVSFVANRAMVVQLGCVDPQFDDSDLMQLAALPSSVVSPIAAAIMRLSGATKEASKEAEKNS